MRERKKAGDISVSYRLVMFSLCTWKCFLGESWGNIFISWLLSASDSSPDGNSDFHCFSSFLTSYTTSFLSFAHAPILVDSWPTLNNHWREEERGKDTQFSSITQRFTNKDRQCLIDDNKHWCKVFNKLSNWRMLLLLSRSLLLVRTHLVAFVNVKAISRSGINISTAFHLWQSYQSQSVQLVFELVAIQCR